MVEVANPSSDDQMIIPDRHISPRLNHSSEPDYYSSLEEKIGFKRRTFKAYLFLELAISAPYYLFIHLSHLGLHHFYLIGQQLVLIVFACFLQVHLRFALVAFSH